MLSIEHTYFVSALQGVDKIVLKEDFDNLRDTWFCFLVLSDGNTLTGVCRASNMSVEDSKKFAKEDALRKLV